MANRSGKEKGPARIAAQKLIDPGEKLGAARPSEGGLRFNVKKDERIIAYINVDIHNHAIRTVAISISGEAHNKGKKNKKKKKE